MIFIIFFLFGPLLDFLGEEYVGVIFKVFTNFTANHVTFHSSYIMEDD